MRISRCMRKVLISIGLFQANVPFLNPWKRLKTRGFLTFPGGIEIEHWLEMVKDLIWDALLNNVTKSNTYPWVFFTFFKSYKWYQITQNVPFKLLTASILEVFTNFASTANCLNKPFKATKTIDAKIAYNRNVFLNYFPKKS